MTFDEAVAFVDSRIYYGIRPGTERVAALVDVLGNPERSYPVVHVSGTNGKYSVVAITTSILMELGLVVGSCISPHLETVRERITFDGEPIDEEAFARVVSYLEPFIAEVEKTRDDKLTYQEVLTAMAFEALFDRPVHVGVLETGLGGEYDASNVAEAQVAVVTNVSLDHVKQFGRDLSKATWEKAGIIKRDSLVVCGVEQDDLFAIVESRAAERGARGVFRLGRDFEVAERRPAHGGQSVSVRGVHGEYDDIFLSLYGAHQATNAALAIAACEAFVGEALNTPSLERALASVRTAGRIDVVGRRPVVALDGGHNPAAAAAVRAAIEESFTYDRLIVVVGMLEDKLIEEVLQIWTPVVQQWIVTTPHSERAAAPQRIVDALIDDGIGSDAIDVIDDVATAVTSAVERASRNDFVLVFGSFSTVGEAMGALRSRGALAQS